MDGAVHGLKWPSREDRGDPNYTPWMNGMDLDRNIA